MKISDWENPSELERIWENLRKINGPTVASHKISHLKAQKTCDAEELQLRLISIIVIINSSALLTRKQKKTDDLPANLPKSSVIIE